MIYFLQGESQKAIKDYDKAIQIEPDNARTYTLQGEVLRNSVSMTSPTRISLKPAS
jgi:cytochrome c-type biogenesis protein CcmH/NrfG